MPDADRLAEIRDREMAATEGPWLVERYEQTLTRRVVNDTGILDIDFGYLGNRNQDDAEFVAHARADIPYLLVTIQELGAQLAAAERHNAELDRRLHAAEQQRANYTPPSCDRLRDDL